MERPQTFSLMPARKTGAVYLIVALLFGSGCAHRSPQNRVAHGLLVGGALAVAIGGATAGGCIDDLGDGGCSGSPSDADLVVGIPVLVAGVGMVVAGLLLRQGGPTSGLPPPVMPDPFVEPINAPPTSGVEVGP